MVGGRNRSAHTQMSLHTREHVPMCSQMHAHTCVHAHRDRHAHIHTYTRALTLTLNLPLDTAGGGSRSNSLQDGPWPWPCLPALLPREQMGCGSMCASVGLHVCASLRDVEGGGSPGSPYMVPVTPVLPATSSVLGGCVSLSRNGDSCVSPQSFPALPLGPGDELAEGRTWPCGRVSCWGCRARFPVLGSALLARSPVLRPRYSSPLGPGEG